MCRMHEIHTRIMFVIKLHVKNRVTSTLARNLCCILHYKYAGNLIVTLLCNKFSLSNISNVVVYLNRKYVCQRYYEILIIFIIVYIIYSVKMCVLKKILSHSYIKKTCTSDNIA